MYPQRGDAENRPDSREGRKGGSSSESETSPEECGSVVLWPPSSSPSSLGLGLATSSVCGRRYQKREWESEVVSLRTRAWPGTGIGTGTIDLLCIALHLYLKLGRVKSSIHPKGNVNVNGEGRFFFFFS